MAKADTVLVVKPPGPRSLFGHWSSRQFGQGLVLLLLISRVEALLLAAERPGLVQQLPRGSAARHLLRLAGRAQPLVEGLDGRVEAGGAQGRHVQGGTQPGVPLVADLRPAADAA